MKAVFLGHFAATVAPRILAKAKTPLETSILDDEGDAVANTTPRLDPRKFQDPLVTARGERRAHVALKALETLWFNTGTLGFLYLDRFALALSSQPCGELIGGVEQPGIAGLVENRIS